MEKTKKFKLLKDLPDIRAGVIFVTGKYNNNYWEKDKMKASYHKDIVENTPDWFAEIVEPKFPKGIVAMEESGKKDLRWYMGTPFTEESYQKWVSGVLGRGGKITQVQNSSGEVFSVGDRVESYGDKYSIMDFSIHEGELFARIHDCIRVSIDNLTKPSAPKTFTQEQVEKAIEKAMWTKVIIVEDFRKALGI